MEPRQIRAEAKIHVGVPRDIVDVIISSLQPELASGISDRSKVVMEASEIGITIDVVADDMVALRAAVNSYLYWIQGIMDIGSRVNS